jgi:hypothetical protein
VCAQNNETSGRPSTVPPASSTSAAFAAQILPSASQAQAGAAIIANASATKAAVLIPRSIPLSRTGPLPEPFVDPVDHIRKSTKFTIRKDEFQFLMQRDNG